MDKNVLWIFCTNEMIHFSFTTNAHPVVQNALMYACMQNACINVTIGLTFA